MSIFIDTSVLYALLDRDDATHSDARVIWERLLDERTTMVVSNYILVETLALVQHRLGHAAVRVVIDDILPALHTHWIGPEIHSAALAALRFAGRRKLSFVDCTSFETMRALGLTTAFTLDRHFVEAGFTALPVIITKGPA